MTRRVALVAVALAVAAWEAPAQEALRASYQRAQALAQAGAPEEQQRGAYGEAFDHFLRLPSDDAAWRQWLPAGAFAGLRAGDAERAATLFATGIELGGADAFLVEHLLRARFAARQPGPALAAARRHVEAFPQAVRRVLVQEAGLTRGGGLATAAAWLRAGDREAGLWVFRHAVEAGDGSALDLGNLALALRYLGEAEAAEAGYLEALERAPEDAILWNDYGLFLKGQGRTVDAQQALLQSQRCERPPNTGPATTNLVRLWIATGVSPLADPVAALAAVLAERPSADLARRTLLDGIAETEKAMPVGNGARVPDRGDGLR